MTLQDGLLWPFVFNLVCTYLALPPIAEQAKRLPYTHVPLNAVAQAWQAEHNDILGVILQFGLPDRYHHNNRLALRPGLSGATLVFK